MKVNDSEGWITTRQLLNWWARGSPPLTVLVMMVKKRRMMMMVVVGMQYAKNQLLKGTECSIYHNIFFCWGGVRRKIWENTLEDCDLINDWDTRTSLSLTFIYMYRIKMKSHFKHQSSSQCALFASCVWKWCGWNCNGKEAELHLVPSVCLTIIKLH